MIFRPRTSRQRARRALLISALTLLLLSPTLALQAQEPPAPSAAAENAADNEGEDARATLHHHELKVPDGLKVGDTVQLSVEIKHAPDLRLTVVPDAEGSRWERVSLATDARDEGGFKFTTFDLEYAVFRPGPTRSPEVIIRALGDEGEPVEIEVPRTPVTVAPISDAGAGLLSARGARSLLVSDATPYLIAGGVLGLLALGAIAGLMARRRRRPEASDAPRQPPAEEALQKLEFLAKSSLLDQGETMAYYVRLSETLRTYLGRRWDFPGTELTTTEIVERLNERATLPADLDAGDLARWLRACDRVKFAGHEPSSTEARQHLQSAFHIVERTRPRPEQPEGAETPSAQSAEKTVESAPKNEPPVSTAPPSAEPTSSQPASTEPPKPQPPSAAPNAEEDER